MAESGVSKTSGDGTIVITDGGSLSYTVAVEDGDFAGDAPKADKVVVYDRNDIVGLRKGKNQTKSGSFTVDLRQFTGGTDATIIDVIEKTGAWANATSVAGAAFEEFLVKIKYTADGIARGDSADHTISYDKTLLEWSFKEGDRSKITVKWTSYDNSKPTRTGPA